MGLLAEAPESSRPYAARREISKKGRKFQRYRVVFARIEFEKSGSNSTGIGLVTVRYLRLPKITQDYLRLPSITQAKNAFPVERTDGFDENYPKESKNLVFAEFSSL